MHTKISSPTYLEALYKDIPIKNSWNESLLAGIELVKSEIANRKLQDRDVYAVEIERDDERKSDSSWGDYACVRHSKDNVPTDYYYVDVHAFDEKTSEYIDCYNSEFYVAIHEALSEYISSKDVFILVKSQYDIDVSDSGYLTLVMRAYFVKKPKRIE